MMWEHELIYDHSPQHDYKAYQFFYAVKSEWPSGSLFRASDEAIEFHAAHLAKMRINDADAKHRSQES